MSSVIYVQLFFFIFNIKLYIVLNCNYFNLSHIINSHTCIIKCNPPPKKKIKKKKSHVSLTLLSSWNYRYLAIIVYDGSVCFFKIQLSFNETNFCMKVWGLYFRVPYFDITYTCVCTEIYYTKCPYRTYQFSVFCGL